MYLDKKAISYLGYNVKFCLKGFNFFQVISFYPKNELLIMLSISS